MDVASILFLTFAVIFLFLGFVFVVSLIGRATKRGGNNSTFQESAPAHEDDELEKESVEGSEGDGLMLYDDPIFIPKFYDEDKDM